MSAYSTWMVSNTALELKARETHLFTLVVRPAFVQPYARGPLAAMTSGLKSTATVRQDFKGREGPAEQSPAVQAQG